MLSAWDPEEAALRDTAVELRERLRLVPELGRLGDVVLTGSAALKTMVARDIDLTVIVDRLDENTLRHLAALSSRLTLRHGVREVLLRNDAGHWNVDPRYPDGHYLRIHALGADEHLWSIDIWVIAEPDRQPDLSHLKTLGSRITPETQAAILSIKRAHSWILRDGHRMPSVEVYWAVLDHGITDADGFRKHMSDRIQ